MFIRLFIPTNLLAKYKKNLAYLQNKYIFGCMKNKEDKLFNKLANMSKEGTSRLHILEETIPVNEQMEYFNYSSRIREDAGRYLNRNYLVSILFDPDYAIEEKRRSLSLLASLPDVAAYRAIETYHSSPLEPELTNWSSLALVESRILLNSELTGEQQIFISTGLGGHNNKLRYFCVISSKSGEDFTVLQNEIIEREFKFQFECKKIEIEKTNNWGYYITYIFLADLTIDVKAFIEQVVSECNQYGDFININFLITNTKQLSNEEIELNLKKQHLDISPDIATEN